MTANSLVIGLTGNIATGKSTVLDYLARLGAYIIDADKLAHQAMISGWPSLPRSCGRIRPNDPQRRQDHQSQSFGANCLHQCRSAQQTRAYCPSGCLCHDLEIGRGCPFQCDCSGSGQAAGGRPHVFAMRRSLGCDGAARCAIAALDGKSWNGRGDCS